MAENNKDIQEIKKTLNGIHKELRTLNEKLSKHIVFIEEVYAPLQKSIDKFKRLFK